jgi:hypothetical protein
VNAVFYILLGWLLTVGAAWGYGWLLLRLFRLDGEEANTAAIYRFLLGAATLSVLVFGLASAGWVYKGSVLALQAGGIALLLWKRPRPGDFPRTRTRWLYGGFALYYFAYALMPEMSPDGMSYHLGLVNRYYREHGFSLLPANMYAHLSQALEMLFLAAFALGKHSAAALVHFTFLLLFPPLLALHAGKTGWYAGLFVFLLPLVALDGVSAYNDVALTVCGVAVMDAMVRWQGSGEAKWVCAAALLAGFAFGIKYTGALLLLLLLPAWRQSACWLWAGFASLPWLGKNFAYTGNPLAPFFNAWFPNPYFTESMEAGYRAFLRHYDVVSAGEWLREIIVGGPRLSGYLGPAALLLPLGLLAWKHRQGRWWLAGAAVTLAVYPMNIGTRFLLPALPFLALGLMHLAGERRNWVLAAAAVTMWPTVRKAYAHEYSWTFDRIEWRAALRVDSEESYLTRKRAGYITARTIEVFVPPGETVYALSPVAESYTNRNVIVSYQSKLGFQLLDALANPFGKGTQVEAYYACPGNRIEVEKDTRDIWSISEIEPKPQSFTCNRQPGDTRLAFDGNFGTRWSSGSPTRAGDACELRGEGPWKLWAPLNQWEISLRGCERVAMAPEVDYREAAREYFLREGIRYLAIDEVDFPAADMKAQPDAWGLELVAERGAMRIYRWRNPDKLE